MQYRCLKPWNGPPIVPRARIRYSNTSAANGGRLYDQKNTRADSPRAVEADSESAWAHFTADLADGEPDFADTVPASAQEREAK